ncbi:3-isopropylmalate/(R)-2-methylmalate dehydratase large subunit [Hymenobacter luteus]|uniref:3-isopropylmalate dehydratase large subunit n=2 Tax=Hymenobacter TaxID=89966 RepID=A0A7W9T5I1_9BACT|nr:MULTISPECIES: 3-isopropylmalate dehydratase large subunit [Hymenobacter]MBB4602907.1 3-isopropylmalate/(R)-2-methylmalate dehydratase large subunit [Hymenobacter latericoloratus]MBB6060799.1 3-isopropylmalate/(R)-2-methylmalate dehydratase large subunit [Hymenobacter luteus]
MAKTLFDKIWDAHVVREVAGGLTVFYIDRHLIHEVTSPQAFDELTARGLTLRRPEQIVATADHNVPTRHQNQPIQDPLSRSQVDKLTENCATFGVELYGLGHQYQGIVHVIGPELGITQPGLTMVCGDSHTSTHGAFGTIAFGIGTSQVTQVMASQCLLLDKPKRMRITLDGDLRPGVTAKDLILYVISQLGTGGATGYFVEYAGSAIRGLSMEGRMTVCNMSIEMGARGGLIAPDATTFEYVKGRRFAPQGENWDRAVAYWQTLYSDEDAVFDAELQFDASAIQPMITYGTNPGMGIPLSASIPVLNGGSEATSFDKSLRYMGFQPGESLLGKEINYVFIGSCTNSRIEDLRTVAAYVRGKQKAAHVEAIIVPGSKQVEQQAIAEGLDKVLADAGFELREPGCSACLAMNDDKIPAGAYCVSTSNRNFEGRQGPGARTLLASPLVAAITAVEGRLVDITQYLN